MTASWWIADTLTKEGRAREADEAYADLYSDHVEKWHRSHIIARAEAILRKIED